MLVMTLVDVNATFTYITGLEPPGLNRELGCTDRQANQQGATQTGSTFSDYVFSE